jgi:hypothetical protein
MFHQHRAELFHGCIWSSPWFRFHLEARSCCYGCVRPTFYFDSISILWASLYACHHLYGLYSPGKSSRHSGRNVLLDYIIISELSP